MAMGMTVAGTAMVRLFRKACPHTLGGKHRGVVFQAELGKVEGGFETPSTNRFAARHPWGAWS